MLSDTKILPGNFEYFQPKTLADALVLLARWGSRAKVLAGGTDLIVKMKRLLVEPECLVSVQDLPELHGVRQEKLDGSPEDKIAGSAGPRRGGFETRPPDSAWQHALVIGAATPLSLVEKDPLVRLHYSALYEALRSMAAIAARNMGSIGGNLANASPAADTAPPLIVLDAVLRLASARGGRTAPVETFFRGPGLSLLEVDELIVEILLPPPKPQEGSAFLKLGRVSCDISKINVAAWFQREGGLCLDCRIAFGSVAPTPLRTPALENLLVGAEIGERLLHQVSSQAGAAIFPIDDVRSSSQYRRQVAPVLLEEALRTAWIRSGGVL